MISNFTKVCIISSKKYTTFSTIKLNYILKLIIIQNKSDKKTINKLLFYKR